MSTTATPRSRVFIVLCAAAMLAACNDTPTTARTPAVGPTTGTAGDHSSPIEALQCTAQVASRTVSCSPITPSGGASRDVTLGGQGQYVQLTSSNVVYASGTFAFDVTVENLIPQSLATTDGTTPAPNGLRVFFASGPTVTSGTGAISVANPDGTATFTAANQPYFQYSGTALGAEGILSPNETSASKNWQLNVAPTVLTFSFQVYVNTEVQHPKGFVQVTSSSNDVNVGQTQSLTAMVRTVVGAPDNGAAPVTWASSNTSIATVNSSGQVTAITPGSVTITATSDTLVGSADLQICPNMSAVGA